MPSKILLVDDNPAIRRSLRSYIEAKTDWQICGEAENGKVAVEMAQRVSPEIHLDCSVRLGDNPRGGCLLWLGP